LTSCILFGNSADTLGGGILNDLFATLTLSNSTLSENSAFEGGGISSLSGNYALYGGGIVNHDGAPLTLTGSTLSGNTASYGGGIADFGGGSVTDGVLSGNSAGAACPFAGWNAPGTRSTSSALPASRCGLSPSQARASGDHHGSDATRVSCLWD
jgi:hypothetical protein